MFKRAGLLVFILSMLACTTAMARQDPFLGTWKLDLAKSKFNSGLPPKSTIVKFEARQDGYKVLFTTVTAQGRTTHRQVIFLFNGKQRPVPGAAHPTTVENKRVNSRTIVNLVRVNGKVTDRARIVLSRDGKTRTVTETLINAKGKSTTNRLVFTKM